MSTYRNLVDWIDTQQEVVLDVIRIYLGIGLFARGILFITQTEGVAALVDLSNFSLASAALVHYVTFAHLLGGLMLAAGLLTRIAALIQIPILAGAVFLVHLHDGLLSANQSLEFSALVLFLLVVVFLFGSGRWSADYYVFEQDSEIDEEDLEAWWRDDEAEVTGDGVSADPAPAPDTAGEPAGEPSGGGVAVASGSKTLKKRVLEESADVRECACGNDLSHPRVTVEPRYSWTAGFFFMLGISAPVKEVVFYCEECGTVMKRSRDPELLNRYRWHTS
jgi:uncharacterized membrane protein YphA (DoxX/SURF4 family)